VIVGLGIDISEVSRIRETIERRGEAFLKRVFTAAEIAYCRTHRDPYERFAARFAAKEAAMKALGTGWTHGVRWVDLEVVRRPGGRPSLEVHGAAGKIAKKLGVTNIALTITHSANIALAQVIFESDTMAEHKPANRIRRSANRGPRRHSSK
jgi:holo-[acyl-carrier protein] synthase